MVSSQNAHICPLDHFGINGCFAVVVGGNAVFKVDAIHGQDDLVRVIGFQLLDRTGTVCKLILAVNGTADENNIKIRVG